MKRYSITWIDDNNKRIIVERQTKQSALKVACDNYKYNPTICDTKNKTVATTQDEFERM